MAEQATHTTPAPTAEHQLLQSYAGNWKVNCKIFPEPGKPMENTATETIERVGPFWTISKYEMNMMGTPFVGRNTLGYEPHNKQFVMTWIDSMAPVLCTARGTKKGDTLTFEGEFFSSATNQVSKHRFTEKLVSKDERLFEMFVTMPDGKEVKMMSSTYKRA